MGSVMLETKLYTALSQAATILAVSSNRIYPLVLPQEPTYPAIVYTRVSGGQVNDLQGYAGLHNAHISIDIFAETFAAAKSLSTAVHATLNTTTTIRCLLTDDADNYEPELLAYRVSMDFSIWNKE